MSKYLRLISTGMLLFFLISCSQQHQVFSPDKKIQVKLSLEQGALHYSIFCDGKPVILPSALGFAFKNAAPMVSNFEIEDTRATSVDESWKPVWGQRSEIRNYYNQLEVRLKETSDLSREMTVVFRVFNDGVGFRYLLPEQPNLKEIEIMSEETYFHFSGDHHAWWIPDDYDNYEHLYRRTLLSEIPGKHNPTPYPHHVAADRYNQITGVNTPLTLETTDGLYLSIHEADLIDYAEMTLTAVKDRPLTLKSELVPWPDGVKVNGSTPLRTPWRTIQIGRRPGALVESSLILNLNEPCKIEDTSWIKPLKYIGIWWGMHIGKYTWHDGPIHGATTENAKYYIDFAHEHGIPGLLIEGWNLGWDRWGQDGAFNFTIPYDDFDLNEVVRYGREKGVAIIGHHESGGDIPTYEAQIDSAFALYQRLGITAVKTGYAGTIRPMGQHHHGQWMVHHYRMVVQKAADYHLTIDAHEPIKDTGESRTYPNMMTREGVRGMEYNAWSDGNPPEHTTILPFTRMVGGPLDYTPGIFDITFDRYRQENRVYTTVAKQLALYVVLYSPLQMAADLPENYLNQPAFKFIEDVPVNWDETRVLDAQIGDYVSIVRRCGDEWYLGSITDENARQFNIPLTFLAPNTTYTAEIYADAPAADWETNPLPVEMKQMTVTHEDTLPIQLAKGGGMAVRFKKT